MPKSVRAKFVVGVGEKDDEFKKVILHPVYSGSKENEEFFQATPGGRIELTILNQAAFDAFEEGKEYYVDFSPAN